MSAGSYTAWSSALTVKALGRTGSRMRRSAQVSPDAVFGLQPVGAWSIPTVRVPPVPGTQGLVVVVEADAADAAEAAELAAPPESSVPAPAAAAASAATVTTRSARPTGPGLAPGRLTAAGGPT